MKIVALAGGVGGSKLSFGLSKCLKSDEFSVIVNTGDDFRYLGLNICPDLDTVIYSLAGINSPITGWGRENESWIVHEELLNLGAPTWFKLGDKDLALHLFRTELLSKGKSLTEVTHAICKALGVVYPVLPMADSPVATRVITSEFEDLSFQEYFVREKFKPSVQKIEFTGLSDAYLSDKVVTEITYSSLVVICPSNPFVSIDPILNIPGMRNLLSTKNIIAVSPLINKKAVKGPLDKMCHEFGLPSSSATIVKHYGSLLSGIVIDKADEKEAEDISRFGIIPFVTNTLMYDNESKVQLARDVIQFGKKIIED